MADELERYLQLLGGRARAGELLEIRYRIPEGMGRRFVQACEVRAAARTIRALASGSDTFVGVLPRVRPRGRLDDIAPFATVAWVDCDTHASTRTLASLRCPPTMLVASGSEDHRHAYWLLRAPVDLPGLERLNRTLALALGADAGVVTKPHTILRPPTSLNHKHAPPRAVRLLDIDPSRAYDPAELTDGLHAPSPPAPTDVRRDVVPAWPRRARQEGDESVYERLRELPAAEYVRALTGREPNREGKVRCVFHEERTPSLQLYPDGSWCCFGCGRGGTIVDFAAGIWGLGTKGPDFLRVRDRLAEELLGARPASGRAEMEARGVRRLPRAHSMKEEEEEAR
ncbi:CHC2 zinc finger domain-containing protein [Conexibacter sp. DBS9H8]|uniref:CHC2 zinc finger domain-containing protein n=1 Tax=Conexibacter sp. DBS9H8 TaxID=2937801 RepID=UPI00200BBC8A|nr:CHC2 zinc finger domain-containing protein [Conexibacter sp. DBS9H8]